jgi:hypothetical protein
MSGYNDHAPIFRDRAATIQYRTDQVGDAMQTRCAWLGAEADALFVSLCREHGIDPEKASPSPILALERARCECSCDPLALALAQAAGVN